MSPATLQFVVVWCVLTPCIVFGLFWQYGRTYAYCNSLQVKYPSSSSSSSLAQQPLSSQGLLQKLLPAVPIPCGIPPISLPTLPGIFHNDFDLYRHKTFHKPILRSLNSFVGQLISDIPAIASVDIAIILFSGALRPTPQQSWRTDWIAS